MGICFPWEAKGMKYHQLQLQQGLKHCVMYLGKETKNQKEKKPMMVWTVRRLLRKEF